MESIFTNLMNALTWIIELLPDSPFQTVSNADVSEFMGALNWIIPLDKIVAELEVWLSAVIIFYAYQIILRWIKAIG